MTGNGKKHFACEGEDFFITELFTFQDMLLANNLQPGEYTTITVTECGPQIGGSGGQQIVLFCGCKKYVGGIILERNHVNVEI